MYILYIKYFVGDRIKYFGIYVWMVFDGYYGIFGY